MNGDVATWQGGWELPDEYEAAAVPPPLGRGPRAEGPNHMPNQQAEQEGGHVGAASGDTPPTPSFISFVMLHRVRAVVPLGDGSHCT